MGTDAATIFVCVGVIGFLLELAKEKRSRLNLLCCVPLALSPFFAYQRAVLLTLGAVVSVVVIVGMGSTARARLRIRSGEVAVAAPGRGGRRARRVGHPRHHLAEVGHRSARLDLQQHPGSHASNSQAKQ